MTDSIPGDAKERAAETVIATTEQQPGNPWAPVEAITVSVPIRLRDAAGNVILDPRTGQEKTAIDPGWETLARNGAGTYLVWKYDPKTGASKSKTIEAQHLTLHNPSVQLPIAIAAHQAVVTSQAAQVLGTATKAPSTAPGNAPNRLPDNAEIKRMAENWAGKVGQKLSPLKDTNERHHMLMNTLAEAAESFEKALLIHIGKNPDKASQDKVKDLMVSFLNELGMEIIQRKLATPQEYAKALTFMDPKVVSWLWDSIKWKVVKVAAIIASYWILFSRILS